MKVNIKKFIVLWHEISNEYIILQDKFQRLMSYKKIILGQSKACKFPIQHESSKINMKYFSLKRNIVLPVASWKLNQKFDFTTQILPN